MGALHFISLIISQNPDQEKPNFIRDNAECSAYWDQTRAQCFEQQKALEKIIFNGQSLFDFYSAKDINMLVNMSWNKQISAIINSQEFKTEYPLCIHKLEENLKKWLERELNF